MVYEDETSSCIVELFKADDWDSIVNLHKSNNFLPWIWPSKSNLEFIGHAVKQRNLKGLVSVGCGSGLLEWLIHKATGLNVVGIELDKSWWTSKYAGQTFIPMVFTSDSNSGDKIATGRDVALLFCYFNNRLAFLSYINAFQGDCFIVIGPGKGRGTHTEPEPFRITEPVNNLWRLTDFQEVGDTKDFIAVYERITEEH